MAKNKALGKSIFIDKAEVYGEPPYTEKELARAVKLERDNAIQVIIEAAEEFDRLGFIGTALQCRISAGVSKG